MEKRGRKPGRVKDPKNIRKQFLINKLLQDKLDFIIGKTGEHEAVIIRRAIRLLIEQYEASYGEIDLPTEK